MRLAERASTAPQPYVVPPTQKFDGNDGSWATFRLNAGTPGQDFRVLPSTKGGATFVITPDGCLQGIDPPGCQDSRGIDVFESSQNAGFQTSLSSSWNFLGAYAVGLEDDLNMTANGTFGFDKVSLGAAVDNSSLSLPNQLIAGISDTSYWLGMLPLGQAKQSFASLAQPVESFLFQMVNNSKIPSYSYSYTAGAKYQGKGVFGSLILGGYDSSRFEPTTNDFSFTFASDADRQLQVGVNSIMATNTLQGTVSLTGNTHFSLIDSTVPHLWLPTDICSQFETAFGLTYDPTTDLYLVNDTIHQQLVANNPTITIKLVNSVAGATTNFTNIELPYGAFDLQVGYPIYPNATKNYFPIRRAANEEQYVLGRTLLQQAYLTVDYERATFKVAQATFSDPMPQTTIVAILPRDSSTGNNGSSGLSTGAIVGIAIGAAVAVFLAILAFFLVRRRRNKKQKKFELPANELSESG